MDDISTASDWLDEIELINDLGVGTLQDATLSDVHTQLVVCNQLLGIIAAAFVIMMIWGVMQFIIKLVTRNITDYF